MTTAPDAVGVVGLGNMGLPMAGHLLAAGFGVRGYDVRPEAADALARAGGTPTASPAEAVAGAPVAIASLPSVAALREVVGGEHGLASAAPDGLILVETSTLPVAAKAEAADALARVGAVVLDCPLSGTASQMRQLGCRTSERSSQQRHGNRSTAIGVATRKANRHGRSIVPTRSTNPRHRLITSTP